MFTRKHRRARLRTTLIEQLEPRLVMSGDGPSPWQNPARPLDVNNDLAVSPIDALILINRLNTQGVGALPPRTRALDPYFDPDGDWTLSPLDILGVINEINRGGGSNHKRTLDETEVAPAGFLSMPLTHLAGNPGQVTQLNAQLTIGRVEFNEMGVYVVDNELGYVAGLHPDHDGYATAVFRDAQRRVIFSRQDIFRFTNRIDLPSGQFLRVYVLQSASGMDDPARHLRIQSMAMNRMRVGWEEHGPMVSGWQQIGDRGFDDAIVDLFFDQPIDRNSSPVIPSMPDLERPELATISFDATAFDPDLPNDRITYSLDQAPLGAIIDPTTGFFQWTPSETDGPGTFSVIVRATDRDGLFDTEFVRIRVLEVNSPPMLVAFPDVQLRPGERFTTVAQATDMDRPSNRLTYALSAGLPSGLTINSTTGELQYTAPSDVRQAEYPVTVIVRDDGVPTMQDAKSFRIRIVADRVPPTIDPIPDQIIDEMVPWSYGVLVGDLDLPDDSVTLSIDRGAAGLLLDSSTSTLRWIPSEAQGPAIYPVTLLATDRDGRTATRSFSIQVQEVNRRPVLAPIGSFRINSGHTVSFDSMASDPDLPANTLRYAVVGTPPPGATLDPVTGRFTWTSPVNASNSTYNFAVQVSDNGNPPLSDLQSVSIQVIQGPIVLVEEDRFLTSHEFPFVLQDGTTHLRIVYEGLQFDTSDPHSMKDAFELAILDSAGRPVAGVNAINSDGTANRTELQPALIASGTTNQPDSDSSGQWTVDVSHLPTGFVGTVVVRLVNNDSDNATQVTISPQLEQLVAPEAITKDRVIAVREFAPPRDKPSRVYTELDWRHLSDVTPSINIAYDATLYDTDTHRLQAGLTLTNRGSFPFQGPLLVAVSDLSLADVRVANFAGYLPSQSDLFQDPAIASLRGSPYLDLTPLRELQPGESTRLLLEFINDSAATSNERFAYRVNVLGSLNRAPVFTTAPTSAARPDKQYVYPSVAVDPDRDSVRYELISGPPGLSIHPETGIVTWTPSRSDVGNHSVTIEAVDPLQATATQTFSIFVPNSNNINRPPVWISRPAVDAYVGTPYRYDGQASDPDDDTLTYSLVSGPTGLAIAAATGDVFWTPTASDLGTTHSVALQVIDGRGGTAIQEYIIYVHPNPINQPPVFVTTPRESFRVPQWNIGNPQGPVTPDRIEEFIAHGESITRNISIEIPPETTFSATDVVLIVDESGSMRQQSWIANMILSLDRSLQSRGLKSNRYAIVGFGSSSILPRIILSPGNSDAWASAEVASQRAASLQVSGGTEDGYLGIEFAIDSLEFRANATRQAILISDEDRDIVATHLDYGVIRAVLDQKEVDLHSIVDFQVIKPTPDTGWMPFGFVRNSAVTPPTYTVFSELESGGFEKITASEIELSDSDTTIEDYVNLSNAVGGSNWTIPILRRSSPSTIASFTNAFVSTLSSIASQGSRVRIRPTIANAPISVGPLSLQGQQITFPITFRSLGDAWNFQLEFYDLDTPNTVFGSIPVAIATGYRYDFLAIDPDNDPVEYRLAEGSQHGARIDASQRTLIWNPKTAGRYRFTIEATDPLGGIDTQTWTVDAINPIGVNQAPVLDPIPDTSMEFGRLAALQLSAFDRDDDAISYQLLLGDSTGTMPPSGVQLNPITGQFQWLPTADQLGRHEITVQAVDGRGGRAKRSFFVDVIESAIVRNQVPVFVSRPITAAVEGIDYIYPALARDPDNHSIRYTIATGPKGMAIDPTTGIVVWHPTEEQLGIHQVILQATDSVGGRTSQYFQIEVLTINEPPVFTSQPTELAATHQRWLYSITASDPNGDSIDFSLVTAPEGAVIDARNRLDWTPTTNGSYRFVVEADDGRGGLAAQSFTLLAQTNAPPSIDSKPDTFTVLGNGYQYAIVVSDPNPPDRLILMLDSDSIARGMLLQSTPNDNQYLLSWNPSILGTFHVTLTVRDSAGLTQSQSYPLAVLAPSIQNDPPEITSIPTGPAVRNSPWTYRITTVDRNDDAVSVTLDPKTLALGATIDADGVVSWTPQRAGTYPFIVIATDARGAFSHQFFDLVVLGNAPPIITSRPSNEVAVNTPYSYAIEAKDPNTNDILRFDLIQFRRLAGPNPQTSQPNVHATTGLLAWTPDAPGLYELIVAATDDSGASDRQSFQLHVTDSNNSAPTFTNQPRSKIQLNQRYTHQFTASDPDGDRLIFEKITGPEEISIDQQGLLQWTPAQVTSVDTPARFTVRVRDPRGGSEARSFAIHVIHEHRNSSPRIESTALTEAIANRPYTYQVIATDVDGDNLVYRIADSNNPSRVPRGLSIDSNSGLIQWTPALPQVGEYPLTITVFDPYGASDSQSFVLKITGTNVGPRITSVPKPETAVNQPYTYAVTAVDDDGDPIRFSIDPASIVGNMAIDTSTGRFTWTPTALGTYRIGVRASDPSGIGIQQIFDLLVSNSGSTAFNQPPQITTVPSLAAFAGSTYIYDIDASDPEGKALTYAIDEPKTLPEGATFDSQTGLLRWTPTASSIGLSISVRAVTTDPEGLTSIQQWSVGVRPVNQPPEIHSSPITTGTIGGIYQYDLKASDPDGDPLSYKTTIAPNGLSIDRAGRIRWLLDGQLPGDYPITVTVNDGIASSVEQSYVLTLSRDTEQPSVRIAPDRNIVRVGETLPITLITSDNVAIASRTLTLQSRRIGSTINTFNIPLALDADGTTRLKIEPGALGPGVDLFGTWTFIASATDKAGNVADAIPATVVIPNDSDVRPPIANILNPNQITVTEPIDILATVNDDIPDGFQWNLRLTSNTSRHVRSLASGTAQLTRARIHRFDPTLLENGEYTLTFTAQDSGGNVTSDSISVTVDGGLKLGNFSVALQDLTVPVSGLPITVTRRYDTLAANTMGDFGYGWILELSNTKIEVQMDPGRIPDLSGHKPFRDGDRVIVTLPDGTQEGFTFYGKPSQTLFGIPLFYSPAFLPDRGITSELIVNSVDLKKVDEDYLDYGSGRLYNPADRTFGGSYLLRLRNGNELAINAKTGDLGSITDRNGNVLTFTNYGIESSSGRGVRFERDSWNRIVSITDPKNKRVTYEYDSQGNLAAFTDRTGAATRFRYLTSNMNSPHYLDSIVDALGRPVVSNRYDEHGRIKSITNALGDTVTTTSDPETKTQRMTNAIGATITQTLDGRGNVLREIDPVGNLQLRTFDARDRLLSQTQVIGLEDSPANGETNDLKTVNQYDANGNLTQTTDIYGHATITTFGEFGEPTSSIDAFGNVTSNQFDPYTGNLIRTLDPFGGSSAFRYNDRGNVTSTSNTDGTVLFNGVYNKFGELTSLTPTAGRASTIEYNLDGDRTASWYFDGVGNNRVQVLQVTRYDDERRAIGSLQAVLPAGKFLTENVASATISPEYIQAETLTSHSPAGQVVRTVDADGLAVETIYDVRGLAIQTRSESRDETGNSVWNLTRTIYDAAGRTIFATRSYREGTPIEDMYGTHTVYDLSDRAIASREVRGLDIILESFAPSGSNPTRPQFISKLNPANPNASGSLIAESTTTYVPNAHGRVAASTDSYGRVSVQHYDKFGNVLQTRTRTYDENNNPMWLVQRNVIDAFGRIQYATDPYVVADNESPIASSPNTPARPVYGTRSLYDAAGRSVGSQRVMGAVVSMTQQGTGVEAIYTSTITIPGTVVSSTKTEYDNQGRAFKQTAADGQTSVTLYDSRGRVQATLGHPVEPALVGLTGPDYTNRLVRLRTETVYNDVGLASESISNIFQIEERNGTVFKIDRSQQRIVKQIYDSQNRLIETIHPDGTFSSSEFDAQGRVIAEIDPLGNRKDMAYNSSGQLAQVQLPAVPNPLNGNALARPTYQYEYNALGQMTKLIDANNRATQFQFDSAGRSTGRTLPLGNQESFAYDTRNRQLLQVTFEGIYVRMVYDDSATGGGRLSEKQFFDNAVAYNNGSGTPTERLVYSYDAFGRIVQQQYIRPTVTDTYTTAYDSQGRVTQETTPTGFINYEYDLLGRKTKTLSGTTLPTVLSEVTYTYDLLGRLSTVNTVKRDGAIVDSNGAGAGTPPESTTYFYDLLGRPDYTIKPNSVVEDYTFDAMDRIDIQRHYALDNGNVNMTTPFLRTEFDYTYRADGQKTGLTEKEVLGGQTRTSTTSWSYDNAGRLTSETIDHWDNNADQTESYVLDLFGNRISRTVDKPSTAYVDQVFSYLYNANDQVTSETLDNGINGAGVDRTTNYGWTNTQQTSKSVVTPTVSTVTQAMSYGLSGQLERVVTTTQNGSGTVTGRLRVDYRSNTQGIRTISVDWNDANLDGTFAAGERTGSIEYLIDNWNFTGYQQTILEVTKNAAGQATKRVSYTFGTDEITQTVSTLNASTGAVTATQTQTFGHDGRGSVQVLFDAAAAIAQVYTYSAYGELLAIHNGAAAVVGTIGQANLESLAATNKLYNGEGFDTRTGLYNFRARNYSASLGRFERLDPFSGNATDPFSFNKYGFVHGDPVQGIDPTGLSWLDDLSFRGTLAHISFSAWAKGVRPHTNPGASLRDLFGIITGALAPDLVDKVSKEFFELKPVSHRSSSLANADDLQMWSYEVYFGLFHPGEGYKRGNQSGLVPYSPGGMPIGVMTEGNTTAVLMVWPSPDQIGTVGNMRNGSGFIHYEWVPLPKVPRTRQEPIFKEVPVMVTEKVIEGKPIRYETWDPIFQPLIPHQIIILNTQSMGLATGAFIGGAILAMAGFATMNSMMGGFA